jgi:hypothetical protein
MSIEKQGVRGIALGSGSILRVRSLQLVILAFATVGITARAQLPQFDHVVVVIAENHNFGQIIGLTGGALH